MREWISPSVTGCKKSQKLPSHFPKKSSIKGHLRGFHWPLHFPKRTQQKILVWGWSFLSLVLTDWEHVWCDVTHTAAEEPQLTTGAVEVRSTGAVDHLGVWIVHFTAVHNLPQLTPWYVPHHTRAGVATVWHTRHQATKAITTRHRDFRFGVVG